MTHQFTGYHPNPSPIDRMCWFFVEFLRAVAARGSPRLRCGTVVGAVPTPLLNAICHRLIRLRNRILDLMEKVDAGTLRPRAATSRTGGSADRVRKAVPPDERMPRKFGWLVGLGAYEVAACGVAVEKLLAMPEMDPYLAAPQMTRLLRPLCHMLRVQPALLDAATARARARMAAQDASRGKNPEPRANPHRDGAREASGATLPIDENSTA